MERIPSFNSYIEKSIKANWNKDALTDYKGSTLQYHDVAKKIKKLHNNLQILMKLITICVQFYGGLGGF